ncbi:MAG: 50S ribosomal protein L29 [Pelagibacteraceae bacterium TMED124]|nr:MAG: 50S ribosomal protein L29 [Pelagibacteraceae bacterium TMED124]|tara:strand:- start:3661 stop:3849 length:189 start_codon:yes stop_codon:yes gene_type:complete
MKKKDIKKMTKDQSKREIDKLKKDLFNMRFKKINGQLQNIAEYGTIKRNIARLYNNILGNKK